MDFPTFSKTWQPHTEGEHSYYSSIRAQDHEVYEKAIASVKVESADNQQIWNFHKCKFCPYRTKSFPVMRSHLRRHKFTRFSKSFNCLTAHLEQYKCSSCDYRTPYLINFKKHVEVAHRSREVEGENGTRAARFPASAMNMNWRNNSQRTYCCDNCSFTTYSQIFYVSHYRTCPVKRFLKENNRKKLQEQEKIIKWRKMQDKQRLEKTFPHPNMKPTKEKQRLGKTFPRPKVKRTNEKQRLEKTLPLLKVKRGRKKRSKQTDPVPIQELKIEETTEGFEASPQEPPKLKRQKVIKIPKKPHYRPVFCCWKCPFKSSFVTGYVNHLYHKHVGDGDIQWTHCEQCSYKSIFPGHLKKHIQTKHNNSVKCNLCTFRTSTRVALRVHIVEKHMSSDKKAVVVIEKLKKFKCLSCQFQNVEPDVVKEHILTNHVSTETVLCFKCNVCKFATIDEAQLKEHVLEHVDPPLVTWVHCDLCDAKYKTKEDLKTHIYDKHIL